MKFLYIILLLPFKTFSQKKDTIAHDKLSLYFNAENKLYKVIRDDTGEKFNGWGKFKSYEGYEYSFYNNNSLIYVDFRDFAGNIKKREIICKGYNNCLEQYEYYDNNLNIIKKKYFICTTLSEDEEIVEKKCRDYLEYYRNGQIKIKGHYENNHEDGIWTYYGENGKIEKKVIKNLVK